MSKNIIETSKITEKQKLTISKGLLSYAYIMSHKEDDEDFRDVFTDFYLSSQGRMRKEPNRSALFNLMRTCSSDTELLAIVKELYKTVNMYEFSFATKMLHTVNDLSPIYDSKVRNYLKKCYGIKPHNNTCGRKTKDEKLSDIEHDWEELNKWYKGFLKSEIGKEWIAWFDKNFPDYKNISNVKKVDFIIFACN